ncbi:shikimate kinase [Candidatus Persebacteraceae bacterium Df01]|jgi:shikimate kinase|uniref:Shikimate kinase n=1 Tax=Candidatus Doriopsillibacter californiensis TaxID=2970740 RepID=A0ABT7QK20_9GAMM|nr:shikimate kinase [Candidatus Persebacteraceae bacterium Df01]
MNGHIILIGMTGSGKTTVGKALALLLQRKFMDIDADIERREQLSISDIFSQQGETAFRAIETATLKETLTIKDWRVIATGGGTVLSDTNGSQMRKVGWVVYLQTPLPLLEARLTADKGKRPLLDSEDLSATLANMLQRREIFYQRLAHLAVAQAADDTPQQIAEKIHVGLRYVTHD